MSGESENSVASEVNQTENEDTKNEDTSDKAKTEAADTKEASPEPDANSVETRKNNEKKNVAKSDEENDASDDEKDEQKLDDEKGTKSSSPQSEVEKDGELKDETKSTSKAESPVEKSTARDKKKANQVADDSPDSKELKTDIPAGKGTQLGDIPRVDASISRFKNEDLKLLHRLLFKAPGKTALIKKNIKKFNGFDFTKNTDEYDKKIVSAKKFEIKQLKSICEMLDLEKKGSKEEIIERIIDFLLEPKDSGRGVGGGRPKRTAAVRANNRGYSSHDDSYSSDEKRVYRGGRGKGRRTNLKDDTTSESDEEFHPSDASETKSRGAKRKKVGGRKKTDLEEIEDVSEGGDSITSEDSDEEPRKRKKIKKVINVPSKGRGRPKGSAKKAVETEKKPPPTKKVSNQKSKGSSESEAEDANTSSSEDEPLIKKAKSSQPPTDDEIRKYVKEILDGANLEEITMKTVCKQVYAHYPDFDLAHKKEFIKETVKSLIST